jgi:hypothetical protein
MARNFKELEKGMSAERIHRRNERVDAIIKSIPLSELRAAQIRPPFANWNAAPTCISVR